MIAPGPLVRKILGKRLFFFVATFYRGFFMDGKKLVHALPEMPRGAHILDIGGGDGALLNDLYKRFSDVHVTMIDTAPVIGQAINPHLLSHITQRPATSIASAKDLTPDFIFVFDVVHHVLPEERASFFETLCFFIDKGTTVVIKDIEPGSIRAYLAYWTDRYISGDRTVQQITSAELIAALEKIKPDIEHTSTNLIEKDAPNYCITFSQKS